MPALVGPQETLIEIIRRYIRLSTLGWPIEQFIANLDAVWELVQFNANLKAFAYYLNHFLATRIHPETEEVDYLIEHVLVKIVSILTNPEIRISQLFYIIDRCRLQWPENLFLRLVTRRLVNVCLYMSEGLEYISSSDSDSDSD